ncbi:MAG: septum formation initiator family protein [Tannerellaceae bacterium]|jgi:cell division protein FtsB|nr:septum formation initiator family protein [Tannerellaceae bacterium]
MFRAKEFYDKYLSHINAYWMVTIGFVALTFVAGESNLYKHYSYTKKIHELEKEIAQHKAEIENDKKKLRDFHTNKEGLERFAREEYLMKKPNEDLFIIKER